MKKNYTKLAVTALVLSAKLAVAQVSTYVFQQQQSVYTPITGGTVFATSTTDDGAFCNPAAPATAGATGPGIPIGFTFIFNNTPYDVFGIDNNGWIAFGQSTLTPNAVNLNNTGLGLGLSGASTAPAMLQNRVAGLGRDLVANGGNLRVETIGAAPNRTCVIQWTGYRNFGGATSESVNFQIRLQETTNVVSVIYGNWVMTSANTAQVGLRGSVNTDFNNRSVIAPNVWSSSIPGAVNTAACAFNGTGLVPNNGQKYEWTPPPPCTTPPPSDALASHTNVCPGASVTLSLSMTYTDTGYTYQWQSSTTGTAGVFSNITGSVPSISSGSFAVTTAFRCVITCTNGPTTINTTPILVNVGAPTISNAVAAFSLICPNNNGQLSLSMSYVGLGVNYQWQSSATSIVGPFTNVSGTTSATSGTLSTLTSLSLTSNTYYQAILSCSALPTFSSVSNAVAINIAGTTINSIPYYETFEGITANNQLPNCSWATTNPTVICQTYTQAAANNRIPHSGSKFASFKSGTNPNGDYFYTNGLQLVAGITYSAAAWYTTDGNLGWSELSMFISPNQSTTALTNVASITGAVSGMFYQALTNTFVVPTSGIYYLAIKCIGNATPQFLSFDDISVTIPCSLNSPSLSITANSSTICAGSLLNLTASGANSYAWSNGATTSSINLNPVGLGVNNYSVTGTNLLTGCTSVLNQTILVLPTPVVLISANPATVCAGQPATLTVLGNAGSFQWNSGASTPFIVVSPTIATSYSVLGQSVNGCNSTASQLVNVAPLPVITAVSSQANACKNDEINLVANGATTYQWISNSIPNVYQGTSINITMNTSAQFTVIGTNAANGCSGKTFLSQTINECVGIDEYKGLNSAKIYPNPSVGEYYVELNNGLLNTIEVIDFTGKLIETQVTSAEINRVNLTGYANGIYFLTIKSEKGSQTVKLIKQ